MKLVVAIFMTAVCAFVAVVGVYINKFGTSLSEKQEQWGQFGDYVGGMLNPTFSLLAFGALLWSIHLQGKELKATTDQIKEDADVSKLELARLKNDQLANELLLVVRHVDAKIYHILDQVISPFGSQPELTISQINSEANRISKSGGDSVALSRFLTQSQTPGSVIEAKTRELLELVHDMKGFLDNYSSLVDGKFSPVMSFYSQRIVRVIPLLKMIGGIDSGVTSFFESSAKMHRV